MSQNHQGSTLLERIEAFSFDEGQPLLTFSRRLARENGWNIVHADRVLREYKRFAYLAMVAGHPVTPSEPVDQAWHLHLTYTRSYWHRFCRDTLGQPLHHEPTRGGSDESTKHQNQYAQTLVSYEKHFGEPAPRDIWPAMEFTASSERWVDTSRNWVVPKPRLPQRSQPLLAAAVALPVAAAWNPFDFDGPTFLAFYTVVAVATFVMGLLLRRFSSDGSEATELPEVRDPYEVAYLASGTTGVIQAALTNLARRDYLVIERGRVARGNPLPADAASVEKALVEAFPKSGSVLLSEFKDAVTTVKPAIAELRDRLQTSGLITPHPDEAFTRRWLPFLMMGAVTLLGFTKVIVGIVRDKPVAFLAVLSICGLIATIFFLTRSRLTKRGEAVAAGLQKEYRSLKSERFDSLSPLDAALYVGLFGSAAMVGTELTSIHDMKRQWDSSAASGCGTSGCGGGGCGGGGCGGCGGCG